MPPHRELIVGIDGGGTRSKAVAIDRQGRLAGRGSAGPSNPNNVGWENAAQAIVDAIADWLPPSSDRIVSLGAGIAGLAQPEEQERFRRVLLKRAPALDARRLIVTHDLEIAHHAAFRNQAGIVLIAGTGSACYAKDALGNAYRASGRAPGRDDPGSGYDLGMKAIAHGATAPSSDRMDVSQLAPRLLQQAALGEPWAEQAVESAARGLVALCEEACQMMPDFEGPLSLALAGSLLEANPFYRSKVVALIAQTEPRLRCATSEHEAQWGALSLAWSRLCSEPLPDLDPAI